jgi:hypothetical protein
MRSIKDNIMYKKLILASAISAIIAPAASAATWLATGTPAVHTIEGVEGYTEAAGVGQIDLLVSLGTEYAVNDTVTFTYDVAKATNATYPTTLTSVVGTIGSTVSTDGSAYATGVKQVIAAAAGITVGTRFILNSATADVYTVTGFGANNTVIKFTPGLATALTAAAKTFTLSADAKAVTLGLTTSTANAATYRVTQLGASGSTVNANIKTPAPNVSATGLTAAKQKVAFAAATGTGTAMDTLTTKQQTASTVAQHAWTTNTKFDGVIDVENSRYQFTASTQTTSTNDGTTSAKADEYKYTITNATGTAGVGYSVSPAAIVSSPTKIVATWPHSTAYLDSATTAGVQLTNASDIDHVATGALGTTVGTISVLGTAAGTADKIIITETAAPPTLLGQANFLSIVSSVTSAALPVSTWSPSALLTYTSNSVTGYTKTLAPAATSLAGSWSLNGASITAYGVPYGSAVSRFLWINNAGSTAGDISASLTLGGTTYGPYVVGSSPAKSSTEVGKLLDAALTTAGVTPAESSRGNVLVTVPVKAADVTMSAAYKHIGDADRLGIETSDSVDGTTK